MPLANLFSLDDEAFVKAVYQLLLGRAADPSGLLKYTKDLAHGETRISVVANIATSVEARNANALATLDPDDAALLEQFLAIREKHRQPSRLFSQRQRLIERLDTLDSLVGSVTSSLEILRQAVAVQAGSILYCVRITGGLGDALIIARFLRDFHNHIGSAGHFDVYFHSPDAARQFFSKLPGFRTILHDEHFPKFVERYDFALLANQFLTFSNEHIKADRLIRNAPRVLECHHNIENVRKPIEKYIVNHPTLDGAFANLATKAGHKRFTYLHHMAGIPYGGDRLDIDLQRIPLRAQLTPKQFITVHDGWDTKFDFQAAVDRPTKALPLSTWSDIVMQIRRRYPSHMIVQLGSSTGNEIPGVDISFKDKLSLNESIAILSASALHIDTESGLVHIATALGVPCAVLFGPTSPAWFRYEQNINFSPAHCGDCWWSTTTWMEKCPIGHSTPICMASHTAANLVAQIETRFKNLSYGQEVHSQVREPSIASHDPVVTDAFRIKISQRPIGQ